MPNKKPVTHRVHAEMHKPQLPAYPEIKNEFKAEYDNISKLYKTQLSELLQAGGPTEELVEQSDRQWKSAMTRLSEKLRGFDMSEHDRNRVIIRDFIKSAKREAVEQLRSDSKPDKNQLSAAIDMLDAIHHPHSAMPAQSSGKGAAR